MHICGESKLYKPKIRWPKLDLKGSSSPITTVNSTPNATKMAKSMDTITS